MRNLSRVYVEIGNICNMSCSFCIGNTRPPRQMNGAEFAHVLREIQPYTRHVYLHVLGEPLLHPHLAECLTLAHSAGMRVNITTNGTLLEEKKEMLLHAPALRKVGVSLHSFEGGDEGARERYLKEVAHFATQASAQGMLCELRLWNLGDDSADNGSLFHGLCQHLGLEEEKIAHGFDALRQKGNTTLSPNLFLGMAEQFQWPSMTAPRHNMPIFCHGLRNQAAILCDGTVVPCCLDSCGDIPLGNVFEQSFGEILEGERGKALYEGFSNRNPSEELCRRCGYATRFVKG